MANRCELATNTHTPFQVPPTWLHPQALSKSFVEAFAELFVEHLIRYILVNTATLEQLQYVACN